MKKKTAQKANSITKRRGKKTMKKETMSAKMAAKRTRTV